MKTLIASFVMMSSVAHAEIKHHSCELRIPAWEVHGMGTSSQKNLLKKILSSKNYKNIKITTRGPTNDADHLFLGHTSSAGDVRGTAVLGYMIQDYATVQFYEFPGDIRCQYTMDDHYNASYDKECTGKMIEFAKTLPKCVIVTY